MYDVQNMSHDELTKIIEKNFEKVDEELLKEADKVRKQYYGKSVYLRGLIEISNYCKKDCYYCGISASNKNVNRYRLTKGEILDCCKVGYEAGLNTFVLQGGEDIYFTDDILVDIISAIREEYPTVAITLSLGERTRESYERLFEAGANRYLLRHETASYEHYEKLHPKSHLLSDRMDCLRELKQIGFQTGSGFMVNSPYQTPSDLANDLLFLKDLQPHMVGIGPFISQKDTRFVNFENGSVDQTLVMVALTRLMLPKALIPSTTALGTLSKDGRMQAIMSGANVIMPNLSPVENRSKYALYDGKIVSEVEVVESIQELEKEINSIGYYIDLSRGDCIK